jgi:hypothetical protein
MRNHVNRVNYSQSENSLHFTWTETASERTWRVLKESAVHNRNIWNDPTLTKEDKL